MEQYLANGQISKFDPSIYFGPSINSNEKTIEKFTDDSEWKFTCIEIGNYIASNPILQETEFAGEKKPEIIVTMMEKDENDDIKYAGKGEFKIKFYPSEGEEEIIEFKSMSTKIKIDDSEEEVFWNGLYMSNSKPIIGVTEKVNDKFTLTLFNIKANFDDEETRRTSIVGAFMADQETRDILLNKAITFNLDKKTNINLLIIVLILILALIGIGLFIYFYFLS